MTVKENSQKKNQILEKLIANLNNSSEDPGRDEKYYARVGWIILILGFGSFMLWATFAPLDKGAVASGTVIAYGQRQTIQSANSGVVDSILVKDGEHVTAGQVLIKLNDLQTSAMAVGTRENISGLAAQIRGLEESVERQKQQLVFLKEQISGVRELVAEGYIAKNRLLELERTNAQVAGSLYENQGNLERYRRQLAELKSKLNAFEFDLRNVEIKAPVDGSVFNLEVVTKGAVVQAGAKLLDIAPDKQPLMIEAMLPVNLIDKVQVDLPVQILFSALNQRTTPHIPGKVIMVSADRSTDKQTGMPFYKIQVAVTEQGMEKLQKNVIRAGMPADVFIVTGERTMMNYLLRPILDRAYTSMREE